MTNKQTHILLLLTATSFTSQASAYTPPSSSTQKSQLDAAVIRTHDAGTGAGVDALKELLDIPMVSAAGVIEEDVSADSLLEDLARGKLSRSQFQLKLERMEMKVDQIALFEETVRKRREASEFAMEALRKHKARQWYQQKYVSSDVGFDDNSSSNNNGYFLDLIDEFARGEFSLSDFEDEIQQMGTKEVELFQKAVLERKKEVALAAVRKEIEQEATVAAFGAAFASLLPGFAFAFSLIQQQVLNLTNEQVLIAVPIASAVFTSLFVYNLSVPDGDDIDSYDNEFSKGVRTAFSMGPKRVARNINNTTKRVIGAPAWFLGILAAKVFELKEEVESIPYKISDSLSRKIGETTIEMERAVEDVLAAPERIRKSSSDFVTNTIGESKRNMEQVIEDIRLSPQRSFGENSVTTPLSTTNNNHARLMSQIEMEQAELRREKVRQDLLTLAEESAFRRRNMENGSSSVKVKKLNQIVEEDVFFDSQTINSDSSNTIKRRIKPHEHGSQLFAGKPGVQSQTNNNLSRIVQKYEGRNHQSKNDLKYTSSRVLSNSIAKKDAVQQISVAGKSNAQDSNEKYHSVPNSSLSQTLRIADFIQTNEANLPTISRWRINKDGSLSGNISGSSEADDGDYITTSPIVYGECNSFTTVETGSGSRYFLEASAEHMLQEKLSRHRNRQHTKQFEKNLYAGKPAHKDMESIQNKKLHNNMAAFSAAFEKAKVFNMDVEKHVQTIRDNNKDEDFSNVSKTATIKLEHKVQLHNIASKSKSRGRLDNGKTERSLERARAIARKIAQRSAPRGVPIISNWQKTHNNSVTGKISLAVGFNDGDNITTTPIVKGNLESGSVIETTSGSRYFLS